MSLELAISIVALLIAIASAIYARQSAAEAKTANRISSHQHKLELLQAARDFQGSLRVHGEAVDSSLVFGLLYASSKASLYFTANVADHFSKYANAAQSVHIARVSAQAFESAGLDASKKWEEAFSRVDECRDIESSLLADLEAQTKIVS